MLRNVAVGLLLAGALSPAFLAAALALVVGVWLLTEAGLLSPEFGK